MNAPRISTIVMAMAVTGALAHGQLTFSDQTAAAGLTATHQPTVAGIYPMLSGGAVGDFDGDGYLDMFVPAGGGEADHLFLNDGNGAFTDEAATWGVDALHLGSGVAVGDINHDGLADLFVVSQGPSTEMLPGHHKLYANQGSSFLDVAAAAGVDTTAEFESDGFGAALGDVDLDGDLDLFVAGWVENSGGNRLFQNNGFGTFTDVTATAFDSFDLTPVRGFSPHLIDMDGDRYPELLLAADFGSSQYFINDGDGTFTNVTTAAGTGLDSNGMGQTVADFNGDLLLDWYVTSIHHDTLEQFSGNMLYNCVGGHAYSEDSEVVGVNDGGWGWGTAAIDIDHDGDFDIVETNGWGNDDPPGLWQDEQAYLFLNDGTATFTENALGVGMNHVGDGRGMLHFDAENDGDQDLMFFTYEGPQQYFRNDLSGPGTHWLRVGLDDEDKPGIAPQGYGSRVKVTTGPKTQITSVSGNTTYLSQSQLGAHFGLGLATLATEVEVLWPDGTHTYRFGVAADQKLRIPCCSGFTYLGNSLNGSASPRLTGKSALFGGAPIIFEMENMAPNASVWFVAGLTDLSAAFKGGTLVPSPDVLIQLQSDPQGEFQLESVMPVGLPSDLAIYFQAWITDAAGPKGYAATNGLKAVLP